MTYGYAIFIQEGDVAFPYWFTEHHPSGISDGRALVYASPKQPLFNLRIVREEFPRNCRVLPEEIHVRKIPLTPAQSAALAEAVACCPTGYYGRVWVAGWRNRAEAAATPSERVCEHDTDGDGDCHLCVSRGMCLNETQSQQAPPAPSPAPRAKA